MRLRRKKIVTDLLGMLVCVAVVTMVPVHLALSFSFSEYEAGEKSSETRPAPQLSDLHCPESLTSSRIVSMIGEMHRGKRYVYRGHWRGLFISEESVYGRLIEKLNHGFEQLGLTTYTNDEINEQIAREEQEAFLNNDLEAAMTAADRLQADYMLKGIISTHTQTNRMVKVDEVFVVIDLTLYAGDGTQLSTARVREVTFSDADIAATVQDIVNKQASRITYELFAQYCKGAM
ncbi:MAG: hypothetical protein ABR512_15040 [Desulfopila sp.]